MVFEERRIEVGGLPIRYLEAGAGEPLVLLHALGESASDWRWVLPALARTHRVYAPDLPGFGGSAKPQTDYSPAFFGRFTAGLLDALGLERAA
ncbi:MAG: alpha/beta fold hydrolase, partial [Actinomycetota bacterium]|nr:alpha/beta fold hydrolase [Actinomycetota bacterium]